MDKGGAAHTEGAEEREFRTRKEEKAEMEPGNFQKTAKKKVN